MTSERAQEALTDIVRLVVFRRGSTVECVSVVAR